MRRHRKEHGFIRSKCSPIINKEKKKNSNAYLISLHILWLLFLALACKGVENLPSLGFSTVNPIRITTVPGLQCFSSPCSLLLAHLPHITDMTGWWKQKSPFLQTHFSSVYDHDSCNQQSFCKMNKNIQVLTFCLLYKTIMYCHVFPSWQMCLMRSLANPLIPWYVTDAWN